MLTTEDPHEECGRDLEERRMLQVERIDRDQQSTRQIELSTEERKTLEAVAAKYSTSYRDVVRAKIVLYAAQGLPDEAIAARIDSPR